MSASRPRTRELLVLAAGLAAAAALAWAGVTVHDGLRTAGELAVARLAGAVEDTVRAEWQRMLRASEPPVPPSGESFRLTLGGPRLLPIAGPKEREAEPEKHQASRTSVFSTLLEEAERRELIEQDFEGALELVLEALAKEPDHEDRFKGWLRALQLGARLGRQDVVRAEWERLRVLPLDEGTYPTADWTWMPYRLLAWIALPEEIRAEFPSEQVVSPEELERLYLLDDRLTVGVGPFDAPVATFALSPLLVAFCERMNRALPPLEHRKMRALAGFGTLPRPIADGRWHLEKFIDQPFLVRWVGSQVSMWFYSRHELQDALIEHSALPTGFHLDFEGDLNGLGRAVRPRASLVDSDLEFTLRHEDPERLGREEASRLRLLRGALFALSLACAGGGFLTARLLARQRKLAELKSSFIAGVSHDLRTPLASILLLAENLESGVAAGADPARYHRALRKEATRLRRLVDDVLDFSRLERGQAPKLEREELDLARFAAELEEDLGARVREQGREFGCERAGLPASAALDAHAVRRALENLVDNALKHGRGAVGLGFAVDSGRLRLTVADDGPGIPAAERERVFEPFERLSANGHVGGVGLGLAIVRSIARAHGGEARVRERGTGAGAVFELDLPLAEDPEEDA